jgi:hypothetical protein
MVNRVRDSNGGVGGVPMKEFKIPTELGAVADLLYKLREDRRKIESKAKTIEEQEKLVKEYIIENLDKQKSEGVSGKKAKISISTQRVAAVSDWDAFYAHVLKTKDFSLMIRKLNDGSCRERWDNGEILPGVNPFNTIKVSCTKR